MRDPIKPVDPLAAAACAQAGAPRRTAADPWFAGATTDHARAKAAALPAPALAKRVRPTSSFEGFGSFSG